VREILIKRGGFTRPGCSFSGTPVNESYEGGRRRRRRRRRAVHVLLKPEIKKSDRLNAMPCFLSLISFCL